MWAPAWLLMGGLLVVHLYFRIQALRWSVDEEGRRGTLLPWRLQLPTPDRCKTEQGHRYRNLAIGSALLFMVMTVALMLAIHVSG